MKVPSARFGELEISEADLIDFPAGLPGFAGRRYVLVPHPGEDSIVEWLQSVDEPDVALMTVDPADLMLDYDPTFKPEEIQPIDPEDAADALMIRLIIRKAEVADRIRVNLFAPLLFNVEHRLGMQVPLVGTSYPVSALWPPETPATPDEDKP